MSNASETFTELLKGGGYSLTNARMTVFKALLGEEPLSMHALVERASGIDRASVYRAVELFEKLGIVQRLNTGWKYKVELTDKFSAHHHHLTCIQCGKTVAMRENELEAFVDQIARSHGFKPTAHQIELQGLCQSCQADGTPLD